MTLFAALWPLAAAGTPLLMFAAIAAITHFQHDHTENHTEEDDWDMWTEELNNDVDCPHCDHQLADHGDDGCDHEFELSGDRIEYCDCDWTPDDIRVDVR